MYTTIGFDEQFYAYEVEIHELNNCFIFQDSLVSPIPSRYFKCCVKWKKICDSS